MVRPGTMRLQRLVVAGQAHHADLGVGDHVEHAIEHAQAGTQNGNHDGARAAEFHAVGCSHRGFDLNFVHPHVTGGLIAFLFVLATTFVTKRFTHDQATRAIVTSYYWHFVDVVWIALFFMIYILK